MIDEAAPCHFLFVFWWASFILHQISRVWRCTRATARRWSPNGPAPGRAGWTSTPWRLPSNTTWAWTRRVSNTPRLCSNPSSSSSLRRRSPYRRRWGLRRGAAWLRPTFTKPSDIFPVCRVRPGLVRLQREVTCMECLARLSSVLRWCLLTSPVLLVWWVSVLSLTGLNLTSFTSIVGTNVKTFLTSHEETSQLQWIDRDFLFQMNHSLISATSFLFTRWLWLPNSSKMPIVVFVFQESVFSQW